MRALALFALIGFALPCAALAQSPQELLNTCTRAEDTDRAVAACSSLIESARQGQTGRLSGAYRMRAEAYLRGHRGNEAVADFTEAMRLAPRSASRQWLYASRASAYLEARAYALAIDDADNALRGLGSNASIQNLRCWTRAVSGLDLDVARRACDIALHLLPSNQDILNSRGLVGLKQGRFQDAWNDYDTAVRWGPEDASSRFGRGVAALNLGHTEDGRRDIATAVAADADLYKTFETYGVEVERGPASLAPAH